MKKTKRDMFYLILTTLILLTTLALPSRVIASTTNLFIDGVKVRWIDEVPERINGRTMVPIRVISENMGYNVDWSKDTWSKGKQLVWISKENTKIELEMNKSTALVNGVPVPIDIRDDKTVVDTKPFIKNGRTFVPIRFISEVMGAEVDWEIKGGNLYVYITRPNIQPPVDPEPGTPSKIEGNADQGTDKENFAKIKDFFGQYQYGEGTPTFKALGGSSEGIFFWISNNDVAAPYNTKVVIQAWYTQEDEIMGMDSIHLYKLINPAVKEVLRFYLPNGGADELYKVIDNGYNYRWDKASNYVNKDLSKMIGSDRPVQLIDGQGGLQVLIGSKK